MSDRQCVLVLGLPGVGRSTVATRIVAHWVREPGPVKLMDLQRELKARALNRERPEAPVGKRTTRQILDALTPAAGYEVGGEAEVLYAQDGRRILEVVDTQGAWLENDSGHSDPAHALRQFDLAVSAVLLVLDARVWSLPDGVSHGEWGRTLSVLKTLARRRPGLPMLIVANRCDQLSADAPLNRPGDWPQVASLTARLGELGLDVSTWRCGLNPTLGYSVVAEALLGYLRRAQPSRIRRYAAHVLASLAVLYLGAVALCAWQLHTMATTDPSTDAVAERRFVERNQRRLLWWRWLPGAGTETLSNMLGFSYANQGIQAHARQLAALLEQQPAVLEPHAAVNLAPPQYRTAAQGLELVAGLLDAAESERRRRSAQVDLLREKARIADMPLPSSRTLAGWFELWKTTRDATLRDKVVFPEVRLLVQARFKTAEAAAMRDQSFPELFGPVVETRARFPEVATETYEQALASIWSHAWQVVSQRLSSLPAAKRAAYLVEALDAAPLPPPEAFTLPLGRYLAEAQFGSPTVDSETQRSWRGNLTPAVCLGMATALPGLYRQATGSNEQVGPSNLEALGHVLELMAKDKMPETLAPRLVELKENVGRLRAEHNYSLHIRHAWVYDGFDSIFDRFDLTVTVTGARSGERQLGPLSATRKASFDGDWLYPDHTFAYKAWDPIEVRLHDDQRRVGLTYSDAGSCFGLWKLAQGWADEDNRGGFEPAMSPEPPAPFDFTKWPSLQ